MNWPATATCPGGYRQGGRGLCGKIKILPGINKCKSIFRAHSQWAKNKNGIDDGDGEFMLWCRHVYDSNTVFGSFEGGVSRMLTMIWINMMCNQ